MILSAIYDEPAAGLLGWTQDVTQMFAKVKRGVRTFSEVCSPVRPDQDPRSSAEAALPDDIQ